MQRVLDDSLDIESARYTYVYDKTCSRIINRYLLILNYTVGGFKISEDIFQDPRYLKCSGIHLKYPTGPIETDHF